MNYPQTDGSRLSTNTGKCSINLAVKSKVDNVGRYLPQHSGALSVPIVPAKEKIDSQSGLIEDLRL